MKIALKNIEANPHRDIANYPINDQKVEALDASFEKTGVWPTTLVRKHPAKDGKYQRPFGHHRHVAMLKRYGKDYEIECRVEDLSETVMIQMMISENMDEWGTSAWAEIESISAVVKAAAKGEITLPPIANKTNQMLIRYAPSFIPATDAPKNVRSIAYTGQTIAAFVGWEYGDEASPKVYNALTALQYVEEGLIKLDIFKEMNTSGIRAVISQARQAREDQEMYARQREREAEEAKKKVARLLKEQEQAKADAARYRKERQEAAECQANERAREAAEKREYMEREQAKATQDAKHHRQKAKQEAKETAAVGVKALAEGRGVRGVKEAAQNRRRQTSAPPNIEKFLSEVLKQIHATLNPTVGDEGDPLSVKLHTILEYKDSLDEGTLKNASLTIQKLAERAQMFSEQFLPSAAPIKNAKNAHLSLK